MSHISKRLAAKDRERHPYVRFEHDFRGWWWHYHDKYGRRLFTGDRIYKNPSGAIGDFTRSVSIVGVPSGPLLGREFNTKGLPGPQPRMIRS